MAMDGFLQALSVLTVVLLLSPFIHTDLFPKPTQKTKVKHHLGGPDSFAANRYTDFENQSKPINQSAGISNESREMREFSSGDILFPGPMSKSNCVFGLCSDVMGYPQDKIERLLSRSDFSNYFQIDLPSRFGPAEDDEDESLCETMEHSIFPKTAKNINQEEKTIINVDGHKQGIVFKTCVNKGPCKFSSSFPNGYTSYCKQEYAMRRLMILDKDEKFVFDTFEIPSCCVCKLKKVR